MSTYSNCFYCGGDVEEQYLPRELRWQDKWYILEDVPVGVCQQYCGQKSGSRLGDGTIVTKLFVIGTGFFQVVPFG